MVSHTTMSENASTTRRTFIKASGAVAGLAGSGTAAATEQPSGAGEQQEPRAEFADIVLRNGKVLTVDSDVPDEMTVARSVAVKEGKIMVVCRAKGRIQQYVGPDTTEINLDGRMVVPGYHYNDADNAAPAGDIGREAMWDGRLQPEVEDILEEKGFDPTNVTTEDILNVIEEIASERESEEFTVIRAEELGRAGKPLFYFTKEELDELGPDFPLILVVGDSHLVVNSIMLEEMLNYLPNGKDHLHVVTDENGDPTGQLGMQAKELITMLLRENPTGFMDRGIPDTLSTSRGFAEAGIVGANGHMPGLTLTALNEIFRRGDAIIRFFPWLQFLKGNPLASLFLRGVGNFQQFERADDRGPMVRLPGCSVAQHSGAPDDEMGALTIEEAENPLPDAFSPTGVNKWLSVFVDSSVTEDPELGPLASQYTKRSWEELTEEERRDTDWFNLVEARKHGWTVGGIHNMGSKAIDLAIDSVEDAEEREDKIIQEAFGTNGFDHNVDWLPQVIEKASQKAEDLNIRFGVGLDEALDQRDNDFEGIDEVITSTFGMEGAERWAPLKTLLDAGIPIHIEGSDPDEFPQEWPHWFIQRAVTRENANTGEIIAPEEALTRKEALTALTRWGARFMGMEDEFGSIEEGKWADLVVLDDDLLEVPADQIEQLRPLATFVGGQPSFVEESFRKEANLEDPFADIESAF